MSLVPEVVQMYSAMKSSGAIDNTHCISNNNNLSLVLLIYNFFSLIIV